MIDKAFLESIGITDKDAVQKITDAYAADIQAEKDAAAKIQGDLDTANQTIQSYKDMDIDGIKASVEDYKQKLEQSEADRKAFEYRTKMAQYVKGLNLKNDVYEKYVTDMLTEKGLKFDGGELVGAEKYVGEFREAHADAFAPNPGERAAVPTSQHTPTSLDGVERAFYEKNPELMPASK